MKEISQITNSKSGQDVEIEKKIERSGFNFNRYLKLYTLFKKYIDLPEFNLGSEKYTELQIERLKSFLYQTTEQQQIKTDIKAAIEYLNSEGFNDYSWEKFESFIINKLKEENTIKKREIIKNSFLKIDNYYQNVELFHKHNPFFYDRAKLFWFWNKELFCWEMIDDTDVMIIIDKQLGFGGQLVSSGIKNNYLEAFRQVGRINIPTDAPKRWIQFKDKVFSLRSKNIYDVQPNYFFTNPIPFELGETSETPVMDNLFEEWVGKDYVQTLFEIISYCCVTDYPIHLVFCFVGSGRNGKSRFQALINNFIGNTNVCSTELDLLIENRFESAKLFKKLVCSLGETNFGVMKKTSLIKKLCGGDLIGFEFKNKNPFDAENYAKIIINSNSLPTTTDTSEGFYRRWLIINFFNAFPEGKDILATIPEIEYNNLAKKVTEILPKLLGCGKFTKQGTIKEREMKYKLASNPIGIFLKLFCEEGSENFIKTTDLYNAYCKFLRKIKIRVVSRNEFKTALNEEGFYDKNARKKVDDFNDVYEGGWWIEDIKLKDDFLQQLQQLQLTSLQDSHIETLNEKVVAKVVIVAKIEEAQITEEKIE